MSIFSRGLSTISLIDYSHEHIQLWIVHNIINRLLMSIFSSGLSTSQQHNQINTTGVTSGAGTAFPSREPEFTPGFKWGSCYSIFRFMCMFCRSLFVLLYFFLAIVLSVLLRYTDSDYPFGIFKLFCHGMSTISLIDYSHEYNQLWIDHYH